MRKYSASITKPVPPSIGIRVGFVYGPGEFPKDCAGVVLAHETTEWGTRAVVMMDDGTFTYPRQLTEVGIGCYAL